MPNSSSVHAAGPLVRRRARPARSLVRRRDRPARGLLLTTSIVLLALFVAGCGSADSGGTSRQNADSVSVHLQDTSPAATPTPSAPPGISVVATARVARLTIRTSPGGTVAHTLSNPTSIGGPLTFLVLDVQSGWLKVELPLRPNGSVGWVAQPDVTLSRTPYELIVTMSQHRLDVIYRGRRIARHAVGVGKSVTPTPPGTYYLTELIKPPNPHGSYGPYAFGLSAYSNTLQTFAGGPGQLGLHGTDTPTGLGHDVSHGCVRVANTVITQLAHELPLGTPIEIRR